MDCVLLLRSTLGAHWKITWTSLGKLILKEGVQIKQVKKWGKKEKFMQKE